jgi:hypothetical protein
MKYLYPFYFFILVKLLMDESGFFCYLDIVIVVLLSPCEACEGFMMHTNS